MWGAAFGDGELTIKEGDSEFVTEAKETSGTEETREGERGNGGEGTEGRG